MDNQTPAGAHHRGPPRYQLTAPDYARRLVAGLLADPGLQPLAAPEPDTDTVAAVWLDQLMFAMQLAAGRDPRDPALIPGQSRGAELGRQFLGSGVVEVCCDYCGGLLTVEVAAAVARLMRAWHGDGAPRHWQSLTDAVIPQIREISGDPLANGNMTEADLAEQGRARS